jgi:hypothetical protein
MPHPTPNMAAPARSLVSTVLLLGTPQTPPNLGFSSPRPNLYSRAASGSAPIARKKREGLNDLSKGSKRKDMTAEGSVNPESCKAAAALNKVMTLVKTRREGYD